MASPAQVVSLPDLYRLTSAGGTQVYESRVEDERVLRWTHIRPCPHLKPDGTIGRPKKEPVKSAKAVLYGEAKWEGNANEKTPHEAALVIARNEWKKKVDRGYTETPPVVDPVPHASAKERKGKARGRKVPARALQELKTPMLLQKYGLHDNPLPPRACVSVKRNGVCGFYRVLSDDLVSRRDNEPYRHLGHLKGPLRRLCELAEDWLLGWGFEPRVGDSKIVKAVHMELDLPDEMRLSFQDKMRVLRTTKHAHRDSSRVLGCVFDLADQSVVPFYRRYGALVWAFERWHEELKSAGVEERPLALVRCFTVDGDPSMKRSLTLGLNDVGTPFEGRDEGSFITWLLASYDGHAEKWEPEPPLPPEEAMPWLIGQKEISREARVRLLHRWFVDDLGEEGSVIRDLDGYYEGNDYRSSAVLKHKDFEDEEAVVVGYKAAKGEHEGAIVFVLVSLETGATYNSTFASTYGKSVEDRRVLYMDYESGRRRVEELTVYTVRFQERHDGGVPQFPVIVGEYEPGTKTSGGRSIEEVAKEAFDAYVAESESRTKAKRRGKGKKKAGEGASDE